VFRNLQEAAIWNWMFQTAVWKDTTIRMNDNLFDLKRGQLVTTIRFICKGFNISERATRTLVEKLKNHGMIDTRTDTRATIVTICNYDKFQVKKETPDTRVIEGVSNPRHTPDTNKNEVNKTNKLKEVIITPDGVSNQVWEDFINLRKHKKAPLTNTALNAICKQAEKAGLTLEQALSECCTRGWQSFKADWVKKDLSTTQDRKKQASDENLALQKKIMGIA